jgi:hypothetical protein
MKIEFYHVDAFEVPNYEPIWRCLNKMGVEANLVGVPGNKNTASAGWFDFERFKKYCDEREMPFVTEADPTANIAVTTQNADILRNYSCPRVRLMYGPIMYPLAWGLQDICIQPFDAVLTHGDFYANYFSRWADLSTLPIVGYPRYDDYFSGKLSKKLIHQRWGIKDNKPVLVFLPTWGENTAFEKFLPLLLTLRDQFNIILRPHHCTLRLEPLRMQQLVASGLLILDDAFDLVDVYAGADVVLSDVRSGGLFEAVLCNVPTIGMVIDPAEMTGWLAQHAIGNMISLCSDPQKLSVAIEEVMTSTTQLHHRLQWAEKRVAFRDGHSAQKAAEALITLADNHIKSKFKNISLSSIMTSSFTNT